MYLCVYVVFSLPTLTIIEPIFHYVENQEKHHAKENFKTEYIETLKKHEVEFDEQYIFEELI